MRCPRCQHADTRVVDSRPVEDGAALRRRRHCDSCSERFTTFERLAQTPLIVVKRDGRREEFSAEKLRSGLSKACSKRPVATADIERAVGEIEARLRAEGQAEIAAGRVGELVMETLLGLDQVAYVRFASVYQQFDDVTLFAQLLDRMRGRGRKTDE